MADFIYWTLTVGFILGFSAWMAMGVWLVFWENSASGWFWMILGALMASYSVFTLIVQRPMKHRRPHL